jgi:hypothetical protein
VRPSFAEVARLAVVAIFFLAAPTAGDIGSCGQSADDLDAFKFFAAKGGIDKAKCDECGYSTTICENLRQGKVETTEFPEGCFPLVHDGEVCLDALLASDCDDYRDYVADLGATVPTECNFCPPRDAGTAPTGDQ